MNRNRLAIIVTLLLFIIGMSLTVFAQETSDQQFSESPDPKDVIPLKLINDFVYFPPDIKKKYAGQDFSVILRFYVSRYGYVLNINIINGSGQSDLDNTLVESTKNFIFTPTYVKNESVNSMCIIPISGTVPAPDIEKK